MRIDVNAGLVVEQLQALARFSATQPPNITRIAFTQPDREARQWLKNLCLAAKLNVREDAIGNMFARWHGQMPGLEAVATGSHIDAIPNSGRFDGTVGVLGGLEAIRALQRAGFEPKCDIELLLFTSEEPTRFGIGCLGSRLLSGSLTAEDASHLRDNSGESIETVKTAAGFAGPIDQVWLPHGHYSAFVELHIEQGPLLETEMLSIGIVTGIAAPASLRVTIEGEGGHAGTVLMPQRRDAFLGACEIALGAESAALFSGSIDTVATTGVCRVLPGAVNSIPDRVTLEMDIRDVDPDRRDAVLNAIRASAKQVAGKRRLKVAVEVINADPPAACSPKVIAAVERSCQLLNLTSRHMISRAYHDSLFMARITRVGMIFIPCRGGVSHRPDEYASPEDIANGVRVLAHSLAELAG